MLDIDFLALAKAEPKARKRIRYLALAHFRQGHSRTDIAKFLKVGRNSVNKWVQRFLDDKIPPGRPAQLSDKQLKTIALYVEKQSKTEQGGRLTAYDIQAYVEAQFGISYEVSNIYRLLRLLGFSWITSRSRHPKQSQSVQDAYKKLPAGNDP